MEQIDMGRIFGAILFAMLVVWLSRMPRIQRLRGKKPVMAPAYEQRWKDPVNVQTYEQLKRHRDSLVIVLVFIMWTEGSFWQPAHLLTSFGSWAEIVLGAGLIALFALAWLTLYFLDRRKATMLEPGTNGGKA